MGWLLPALLLGVFIALGVIWVENFRAAFPVGFDVLPGESWWHRVVRIGGGAMDGMVIALGLLWLWSGTFPTGWFIAALIAAAIGAAAILVTGLLQHRQA